MTLTSIPPALQAIDLHKSYPGGRGQPRVTALDGLGFEIGRGTVFGLLGPNGAGKSTTVKILATLTRADSGTATVAGVDVARDPAAVRRRIGLVSQKPSSDPMATGRENLVLAARIQGMGRSEARERAAWLLGRFGLAEAADRLVRTWSGGMSRKLDVAIGLVHRPEVLFLDEPTTGLDPEARAELWAEIGRLAGDDATTVLLTTHYLDEADRLADRLAIVDRGRVVVAGTPEGLKSELRGDTVVVEVGTATRRGRCRRGARGRARRSRRWWPTGLPCAPEPTPAPARSRPCSRRSTPARSRCSAPPWPAPPSTTSTCATSVGRFDPGDPGRRPAMTVVLAHSAYLTRRSVTALVRQPIFLVLTLIQPMVWLLLFGELFKSVVDIPGFAVDGTYVEFLAPGVVAMTALFSAAWAGTVYIDDMERGVMDRMLASPVSRAAMMNGTLAYQAITSVVQTLIVLGVAWLMGARFAWPGVAMTVVAAILLTVIFAALSNAVALLVRQQEALIGISQFTALPLTFLSSAVMSLALAPAWIASVARYNPLDWAVVVSRETLLGSPDWSAVWPRLGALVVVAAVMTWLATQAFGAYQRTA